MGVKSLENSNSLIVRQLDNVFLIDWLTVTFHGVQTWDVQQILGMKSEVPWSLSTSFVNGYPLDLSFGHIHIRHGADNPAYYDDPKKARNDMGISLDMSGQGCREFESWSNKSWQDLITDIFRCGGVLGARMKITRLDLAYDDHSGLLNIWRMKRDVEDRNYISKSKKSMIIWSDDLETDIHGLTLEIGSKKSPVLIRIYDKAAERDYKHEKHWIRVELQLRQDRAQEAMKLLYQRESIGMVASGIVRNYCMFVTPTADTNRARWPIAEYWQRVLDGFEKLRVWVAPGEEYNFSKTEHQLIHQYGQAFQVVYRLSGGSLDAFFSRCCEAHGDLKPKYKHVIEKEMLRRQYMRQEREDLRRQLGFSSPDEFGSYIQSNFADLLVEDPDCPFGR